jgi:tetratricopeptide (TPR) repeat protein
MDEEQECLKEEQQKWLLEAKALQIYKEKAEKWATAGNFMKVVEVMEQAVQERRKVVKSNNSKEAGSAASSEENVRIGPRLVIKAIGPPLTFAYAKALRCTCRPNEASALLQELSLAASSPSATDGNVHMLARAELKILRETERCRREGNQAFSNGQYKQAIQKYSEGLGMDPQNKEVNALFHYNRATAAYWMGRYEEAVQDCGIALQLRRGVYGHAILRRARAYVQLDKLAPAIRDFQTFIYKCNETNILKLKEAEKEMERAREWQQVQRGERKAEERERNQRYQRERQERYTRRDVPVDLSQDYATPTHYEAMEVRQKATGDEIKKAYHRLALKYHPDKNKGDPGAEEKFKEISAAYRVLSESGARRTYDREHGVQ